jgi:hypothetical protein
VKEMVLIKIADRIVNLDNVKMIDLIENEGERKIIFNFIDGSKSFCSKKIDEKDYDFDIIWETLNGLSAFSTLAFLKR